MYSHALSWARRSSTASGPARETERRHRFRPTLDTLEDRTVLSITPLVNLPIDVGPVTAVTNKVGGQQLQAPVNFAGQRAGTLVMDATTAAAQPGDCPVLNLELQPIHLNLLGLHVDTSAICLDVAGEEGEGLLGDLICGLTGGLNLGGILGQVDDVASDLNTFLDQVEGLLDRVLGRAMRVTEVLNTPVTSPVTT